MNWKFSKVNLLKNIQVQEISLVAEGANGLEFISKTAPSNLLVPMVKADKVKKAVYGVVYEPNVEDSQGDMATAEEIEKAAWGALKNDAGVKLMHKDKAAGFIAESYIAKANDPDGYKPGAWAVVIKIEDDALWTEIEKGTFKAFSMGGAAQKVLVEKGVSITKSLIAEYVVAFLKEHKGAIALLVKADSEEKVETILKDIVGDSMVYATDLPSAIKLLQAIAPIVEGMQEAIQEQAEEVAEIGKKIDTTQALAKNAADTAATVADIHRLVSAIAKTAQGRITSPAPGAVSPSDAPPIDPKKY